MPFLKDFFAHLEQASPTRLLVGFAFVLLVTTGGIFGTRMFFSAITEQLQTERERQNTRLLIGEEIVGSITSLERDFYQLAVTHQPAAFKRQIRLLNQTLTRLEHNLSVLHKGGTVTRTLALNVEGVDEVQQTLAFTPEQSATPPLGVIEIAPLLSESRDQAERLKNLLEQRWQAEEEEDLQKFFASELEISLFLKHIPPYFERLTENANRLLVETHERRTAIQNQLADTETRLAHLENILILLIVVIALTAGAFSTRRIALARTRLSEALQELSAQNARSTTMLDTLSDGVYATDLAGNLLLMNQAAEHILGWQNGALVGKNVHTSIHHSHCHGQLLAPEDCPLNQVLSEERKIEGEDFFIHHDGHAVPIAYRASPLYLDGKLAGTLVSFRDISERRKREALLNLQLAALEAAANMIMITDEKGRIEYVNPTFCAGTGYTREEVIGATPALLQSGHHPPDFYEAMWRTLDSRQVWEGEILNKRKDGSVYPEKMTITPILENDEIRHFVAIKWDISSDVAARTRLAMIETAIENINQGVFITRPELSEAGLRIEWVNQGFTRLMGYTRDEIIGERTSRLRTQDADLTGFRKVLQQLATGAPGTWETEYQNKSGQRFPVEIHYAPVRNDKGEMTHIVGLMTDIATRRAEEAALKAARDAALETSRLKSEFLSTMSHEIRTPMNGVIGMTDLLLDTTLNNEQRELAKIIRDSGNALLTIINDILDFSKIEAGRIDIEKYGFPLAQVVEGACELLASQAKAKQLTMTTHVDPGLPELVIGDAVRLRQVLVNLVGNAIKFTPSGEINIRVMPLEEGRIQFSVRDTGIGISPEAQKRLFSAFMQADSSTTRRFGGTGLGLAISRKLVELMGGEIALHSLPGEGSVFWFDLPLPEDDHPAGDKLDAKKTAQTEVAKPPTTPAQEDGPLILLAEDNATNRLLAERLLTRHGYTVHSVHNGEEAVEASRTLPCAAILMDCLMPVMDGFEATAAIRRRDRNTRKHIPIIAMTANAMEGDRERCLAAGMDDYLTKPINVARLTETLARWTRQS
ncbi:MAG: PAS domain S-box protein [Azonexus sp.]|jgi:PAS domain S-box-containing protein|nr:PAS domain S-box protein [Azonexus sp.]